MLDLAPDVPVPSRRAVETAIMRLTRALGPSKLLVGEEACERFSRDESEARPRTPDMVVLAESADDMACALEVARDTDVPITPRAAGTGRTGGAVPVAGGIVLSTVGMGSIKEIDRRELLAVVEPGVVLADLHAAVAAEGLFYPPDPNSLAHCTLGGNVAENAGGPRAFKYGVTRNYVLGLDALLIGGQRFFAGRRTAKGVTGYDVAGLLVGSEGTLALCGDVTLRLLPAPESVMTLLVLFETLAHAARFVEETIAAGIVPRCCELLDAGTLDAVRRAGNPVDAAARAMLIIEVDGDASMCEQQAERIAGLAETVPTLEVLVAQDAAQRDRLWAARREMSPAVRRMAKHKLSEDVVVPRRRTVELFDRVREFSDRLAVRTVTYGHAGDGNFHVNFLWDDPTELPAVEQAIEHLFRQVIALGGTLSGEHGIGVLKAPYLPLEQPEDLIALQRDIKRVFDPRGLLNPGKIFPSTGHGPC